MSDLSRPATIDWRMGMGEILRRHAESNPDHPALVVGEDTWTYQQLYERSASVARGFAALGLEPGDRVAVLLPNDSSILMTWLACAMGRLLFLPINTAFGVDEMKVLRESAKPQAIVTTPDRSDARSVFGGGGAKVVLSGATAADVPSAAVLQQIDGPDLNLDAPADSYVSMLFTSGSTGRPKGVVHDHLFWNSYAEVGYAEPLHLGADTRYLSVMPLFHVNGLGFGWSTLYHGGTSIQEERFSASGFWPRAREVDANCTFIIGAMANMLLVRPPQPDDVDHEMRVISTSALVAEKKVEFERRFDTVMLSCYGMTEGGGCVERVDNRRLGSSGYVSSGTELRLVDEQGQVCGPGSPGSIEMRDIGGGLAVGYWDIDHGGIAQPIRAGGWFATGDYAVLDEDGFLFFQGRQRDRLRRAGENISAVEVEDVLRSHPAVLEVAVIGVPDPIVDEELKAVIELSGSAAVKLEDLLAFAEQRLAKFKRPRYWEIVEDLPRTPTRRVKKHELSLSTEPPVVDVRPAPANSPQTEDRQNDD